MEAVRRIRPGERAAGHATPGMTREEAVATEGMWGGFVTTDAGMVSGWHHHGEFESAIYVLKGGARVEFGTAGGETVDAVAGDFVFVPKGAIHRESNLGDERSEFIVVRAGSGEVVINVDGPEG